MENSTTLFRNCTAATMADGHYGLIADAAILCKAGMITWLGAEDDLPSTQRQNKQVDLEGRLVTPALIDCHTHIVHAGNRAKEFEMRLTGVSYEAIARAGGGIVSTVTATREASVESLVQQSLPRIDCLLAEGISTIEIKSGYGLDIDTELKMLRAARTIERLRQVKVVTSFLGAHAIPAEYRGRADDYVDNVCIPALKQAHDQKLVDAVDGFCEGIAFSTEQITRVFDVARSLGLPVKLHAEQLSNLGGARLAAHYAALSADHLEFLDEPGVEAMAQAGTVAVILPGAYYTLGETQKPPIALFRKYKVPMAVSTDSNPGSSPMTSLLLAMNMACTLFQLTPEEALAGATCNAAIALNMRDRGILAAGNRADFAVWNVGHPAELSYRMGFNPLHRRILGGLA